MRCLGEVLLKTMLQGYRRIIPFGNQKTLTQLVTTWKRFSSESSNQTEETAVARLKLLQTSVGLIPKSGFTQETFIEACKENGKF